MESNRSELMVVGVNVPRSPNMHDGSESRSEVNLLHTSSMNSGRDVIEGLDVTLGDGVRWVSISGSDFT